MFALTDTQRTLQKAARDLAAAEFLPKAAEVDRSEAYPKESVAALRDAGFMGMTIPVEYGGRGLSYLDAVLVIEQIAAACATMGRITVEANMGAIGAIMKYGDEAQKRLAAEYVLGGDKPAICITEPEAGSAASDMRTEAHLDGDDYVLNGDKHWITGGGVSKLHLIFARVFERGAEQGIGGFIVIRGEQSEGLQIGEREAAMGVRGLPETKLHCRDLRVPKDSLLRPPGGLKRGFAALMRAYNAQRVGAGTVALGIAGAAYDRARDYLKARRQFGRPIAEFQGLQWMLADMAVKLSAARALIYKAAAGDEDGFPEMNQAAQAKLFAAEAAQRITHDALQLHGAAGYARSLPLERHVRDARMFTIAGGTAQILRTQIAASELGMKLPQTRDGYLTPPGKTR